VSVFALAALLVYFGSHVPRAVSLPVDDLNTRSTARIGEDQIVIRKPEIAPGDLALSYVGNKNEIASLWLENATLDEQSQHLLFPNSAVPAPARIGYTPDSVPSSPTKSDDTCHTTIEIRRAAGSTPVDALKLYQTDETAGAQRFRQVIMDAGTTTMEIEVHTDSPSEEAVNLPGCHKLLTIGDSTPIHLPPIPVHMIVHGGRIDLHFNPADQALPIWTGQDQTFEAVSLGDGSLRGSSLQIVSTQHSIAPRLDVRTTHAKDDITFNRLKIGSDMVKLDIGRDTEIALVYANGSSLYNYDLIDVVQRNPILSFVFAAVLAPALLKWIRKNCFERLKPLSPNVRTNEDRP
jgi:hypothetical protein